MKLVLSQNMHFRKGIDSRLSTGHIGRGRVDQRGAEDHISKDSHDDEQRTKEESDPSKRDTKKPEPLDTLDATRSNTGANGGTNKALRR